MRLQSLSIILAFGAVTLRPPDAGMVYLGQALQSGQIPEKPKVDSSGAKLFRRILMRPPSVSRWQSAATRR